MTAHPSTHFAAAVRDELWLQGRLVERRLSHGEATRDGNRIVATDMRDDALLAACDAEMERLRAHVVADARVRLVAEATSEGFDRTTSGTMTVTKNGHSIVTTPEFLEHDLALLHAAAADGQRVQRDDVPLVWQNGTAAILLHEAIGHPREHGHEELVWPSWLSIDIPLRERRATFRDVPLLRMSHVIARQIDAPFELPEERVEIHLVDGGSYEPLEELVRIRVAGATLIEGDRATPLAPFLLTRPRREIAPILLGASGASVRYPGVICSREGQELVVGSYAPVMVTR